MEASFGSIAFSRAAKALQEKYGSRAAYKRVSEKSIFQGLSDFEKDFISTRDSFYLASHGENGYPYIQHRGGPKGFLKVMDDRTLAFPDFSGNKQYISMGNIVTDNRVSLIMVDYPAQARLKIFAQAETIDLGSKHAIEKLFVLETEMTRMERIILFHVVAYDWNCAQHITPRYTEAEIQEALAPQHKYISQLENELRELRSKQ